MWVHSTCSTEKVREEDRTGSKFDKFIECLGVMAVRSECNSENLFDYTKEWIDRVNRGGLFPLNDATYRFLCLLKKRYVPSFQVI